MASPNANQVIAKTLRELIELDAANADKSGIAQDEKNRLFFRVDGFDEEVYKPLLDSFANNSWIANRAVEVFNIGLDSETGYEQYNITGDKTATFYRNRVEAGKILVLLFPDNPPSDAQSLSDIHSVTESRVVREGLSLLIKITLDSVSIGERLVDAKMIEGFIKSWSKVLPTPSLRVLTNYLLEFSEASMENLPGDGTLTAKALVKALPALDCFRIEKLVTRIDKTGGLLQGGDLKLLKQVYEAAQIGKQPLEYAEIERFSKLIDKICMNSPEIAKILKEFIESGYEQVHPEALKLDWEKVGSIFGKKTSSSIINRYDAVLNESILQLGIRQDENFDELAIPEISRKTLADLRDKNELDADQIAEFLEENPSLPKRLKQDLKKLARSIPPRRSQNFPLAVTQLALELILSIGGSLERPSLGYEIKVKAKKAGNENLPTKRAMHAFRALYGGIEEFLPSITWDLSLIINKANSIELEDTLPDNLEKSSDSQNDSGEGEILLPGFAEEEAELVELAFTLEVKERNSTSSLTAEVIWLYKTESNLASFANVLCYTELDAFIFRANHPERMLSISKPGRWYSPHYHKKLIEAVKEADCLDSETLDSLSNNIEKLASAYQTFGKTSARQGLFKTYQLFENLLVKYEQLLEVAHQQINTDIMREMALPILNQLWVIKGANWAMVTPLHPLKLITFYNRVHFFEKCLSRAKKIATDSREIVASEKVFVHEIGALASSSGFPVVLSLSSKAHTTAKYYIPVEEENDFEFYLPHDDASGEFGLVTNTENDNRAVEILSRIVNEYLDTYPFSEQGIQIAIANCSNGDLPKAVIESIRKKQGQAGRDLNINLFVHSTNSGPVVYQELSKWLEMSEIGQERKVNSYLPKISVTVIEAPREKIGTIFSHCNSGLVILANVFQNGVTLSPQFHNVQTTAVSSQDFLPVYQSKLKPAMKQALSRDYELNQLDEPVLINSFYRLQYLATSYSQPQDSQKQIIFVKKTNINNWKETLRALHDQFNWVVCYDVNADRRLLQNVCGVDKVSIIRYTTGLGPKRQHNLTTSSSQASQNAVRQRLLAKVKSLIPSQSDAHREELANWLVNQACKVSGDLILRATGPGSLVNELIGVVLTEHYLDSVALEQLQSNNSQKLRIWLSTDEYRHWFDSGNLYNHSRPDLVGVELSIVNAQLFVKIIVAESKFISGDNEEKKAVEQVRAGLLTLSRAWKPGEPFLDSKFWYDQLYGAIAAQLEISPNQATTIGGKLKDIQTGNFNFEIEGHACIFSYKTSPFTLKGKLILDTDENATTPAEYSDIADIRLVSHVHSPQSLAKIIAGILKIEEEVILVAEELEEGILYFEETKKDLILNSADFARSIDQEFYAESGDPGFADDNEEYREDEPITEIRHEHTVDQKEPETEISHNFEESAIVLKEDDFLKSALTETFEENAVEISSNLDSNEFEFPDLLPDDLEEIENTPEKIETFLAMNAYEAIPKLLKAESDSWSQPGVMPHSEFLALLKNYDATGDDELQGREQATYAEQEVQRVFQAKSIRAHIVNSIVGPRVIRIRVSPQLSSKDYHKQIQGLGDILKQRLSLPTEPQIETGSDGTIWIDIARKSAVTIGLNSLLSRSEMNQPKAESRFPVGMSLEGQTEWADLRKTAHWLIGGTSGSGKSIFLRSIILSLLYNNSPDTLQLILIDPKADMAALQKLPFVTEYIMGTESTEQVASLLGDLYAQMQTRIKHMTNAQQTNDIDNFHAFEGHLIYPRVVIVIEEYATLLDSVEKTRKEIELQVRRISAVGRSSGYHMFVCTQNPLSSTLGSSLKANLSGRVALKVQSKDNSQVILDTSGAEKLLKNGDMLYFTEGGEMKRLQAPYVSEPELQTLINKLSDYYRNQTKFS